MWADHLTIDRACRCIGELDLQRGVVLLAAGLHLIKRVLICESGRVDLEQNQLKRASLL